MPVKQCPELPKPPQKLLDTVRGQSELPYGVTKGEALKIITDNNSLTQEYLDLLQGWQEWYNSVAETR